MHDNHNSASLNWSYFHLITCTAISCLLCKLKTFKAVLIKYYIDLVAKHNKAKCHNKILACMVFVELFPLKHLSNCNVLSTI